MKRNLIILFLVLWTLWSDAQNLVPNANFNEYEFLLYYTNCNDTIYKATQWYNPTNWNTFWYLSTLHNNCFEDPYGIWAGVPQNMWGFRWPVSGNAYILIGSTYAWGDGLGTRIPSVQTELLSPLTIGRKYCASFWITYPENYPTSLCTTYNYSREVGMLFTTYKKVFISHDDYYYDLFPPEGFSGPVIQNTRENWLDTINWYPVSGSFIADSNYKYITISHFLPDSLLTTMVFCPNDYTQGVFIDMVSVYDCTGHDYTCNAGGHKRMCAGESVVLGTDADSKRQYRWSPAMGLSDSTAAKPLASPTETTTYYLYVIDEFVQESYDTVTVEVIYCDIFIPNIFSPNGDGQNDVLYVRGQGIEQLTFVVYNRWGQKVFETKDPNHGWDGAINGKPAETGVYVYHVTAVLHDGMTVSRHGNVTVVR